MYDFTSFLYFSMFISLDCNSETPSIMKNITIVDHRVEKLQEKMKHLNSAI